MKYAGTEAEAKQIFGDINDIDCDVCFKTITWKDLHIVGRKLLFGKPQKLYVCAYCASEVTRISKD